MGQTLHCGIARPDPSFHPAMRLYVAEFKCGVIKVGTTAQTGFNRIKTLRLDDAAPVRVHFASGHSLGYLAERELLARVNRIANRHTGREWFTGITFGQAKQLVEQIQRLAIREQGKPATPTPNPDLRSLRVNLSFNDREAAVLEAYAKFVGKPIAVASRELVMPELVRLIHAADSSARL